jgi:hypothetical protein
MFVRSESDVHETPRDSSAYLQFLARAGDALAQSCVTIVG